MPTYDYACAGCGHRFEEFQSMTAPVLKRCPQCKKSKLERLIGAGAGVIFKGSGFYQTDYKGSGGADSSSGTKDSSATKDSAPASGCTPTCGTKDAPAGCAKKKN